MATGIPDQHVGRYNRVRERAGIRGRAVQSDQHVTGEALIDSCELLERAILMTIEIVVERERPGELLAINLDTIVVLRRCGRRDGGCLIDSLVVDRAVVLDYIALGVVEIDGLDNLVSTVPCEVWM